jgi:type II secretory pathway pseudopilin PulG
MKLRAIDLPAAASERAFTMVEIAIALGVIAFALIAIIGVLPTGLQTQRDVREETIVNQDARLLIEAIKTGGRDVTSDIGVYVVKIDNDPTDYSIASGPYSVGKAPPGIWTTNLIQLLTDAGPHTNVMNSITGAIATRGSDLGFHYQIISSVTEASEFFNTPLSNQVYEVRLRFAWPVTANGTAGSEANRYVVRTLISGWYTNGVLYAQQYYHPAP